MKCCTRCSVEQPETEFYGHRARGKIHYDGFCKTCARAAWKEWREKNVEKVREYSRQYKLTPKQKRRKADALRSYYAKDRRRAYLRRYGITPEQFQTMWDNQNGCCAMCFKPFKSVSDAAIDHDHDCCPESCRSCGKCIRGLLHSVCNQKLGMVEKWAECSFAYLNKCAVRKIRARENIDESIQWKS